jgi:hypothetical protein
LHECRPGSYDNILLIQKLLGGSVRKYTYNQTKSMAKGGEGINPKLTKNKWHVVQQWGLPRGKNGTSHPGHIFLVYWDGGSKVRKVDNSRAGDFRDREVNINLWYPGWQYVVLTTGIGPQSDQQRSESKKIAKKAQVLRKQKGSQRITNPAEV